MAIGITGAKGFIGSHLARYILKSRPGVVRLLTRNTANYRCPEGAEALQGDLMSRADCGHFAADLDVVYYPAHNNSPVNSDLDLPGDALANLVLLLKCGSIDHPEDSWRADTIEGDTSLVRITATALNSSGARPRA